MSESPTVLFHGYNLENIIPGNVNTRFPEMERIKAHFQLELDRVKADMATIQGNVNGAFEVFKYGVTQDVGVVRDSLTCRIQEMDARITDLDEQVRQIKEKTEGQGRIFQQFEETIEASRVMVNHLRNLNAVNLAEQAGPSALQQVSKPANNKSAAPAQGKHVSPKPNQEASPEPKPTKVTANVTKGKYPRADCPRCGKSLSTIYMHQHVTQRCKKIDRQPRNSRASDKSNLVTSPSNSENIPQVQNAAKEISDAYCDSTSMAAPSDPQKKNSGRGSSQGEKATCSHCGQTLLKQNLPRHIRLKHKASPRGKCTYCGKTLGAQYLELHIRGVCPMASLKK